MEVELEALVFFFMPSPFFLCHRQDGIKTWHKVFGGGIKIAWHKLFNFFGDGIKRVDIKNWGHKKLVHKNIDIPS